MVSMNTHAPLNVDIRNQNLFVILLIFTFSIDFLTHKKVEEFSFVYLDHEARIISWTQSVFYCEVLCIE